MKPSFLFPSLSMNISIHINMLKTVVIEFRCGVVGNISVSHMLASGSIPGIGIFLRHS